MKDKYLNKIGQYFFYVLLAVCLVLTVIFYLNTGKINTNDTYAKQMADMGSSLDNLLYWGYIMTFLAVILALVLPLFNMVASPKKGLKALLSAIAVAVLIFVCYQFTSGEIMDIPGYTGADNIPSRLKLVETAIFAIYGMVVAAVISLIYAETSKLIK